MLGWFFSSAQPPPFAPFSLDSLIDHNEAVGHEEREIDPNKMATSFIFLGLVCVCLCLCGLDRLDF